MIFSVVSDLFLFRFLVWFELIVATLLVLSLWFSRYWSAFFLSFVAFVLLFFSRRVERRILEFGVSPGGVFR